MANNHNNPNNFQLSAGQTDKKTTLDIICELAAHVKAAITLVFYLILITIALGLGYIVLRVTVWAANTITEAIGL